MSYKWSVFAIDSMSRMLSRSMLCMCATTRWLPAVYSSHVNVLLLNAAFYAENKTLWNVQLYYVICFNKVVSRVYSSSYVCVWLLLTLYMLVCACRVGTCMVYGVFIAYSSRYRPDEERPERQRYSWRNSTSSQNGGDSNKGTHNTLLHQLPVTKLHVAIIVRACIHQEWNPVVLIVQSDETQSTTFQSDDVQMIAPGPCTFA